MRPSEHISWHLLVQGCKTVAVSSVPGSLDSVRVFLQGARGKLPSLKLAIQLVNSISGRTEAKDSGRCFCPVGCH